MTTELTGTVMGGELKLDQSLELPDQSRVRVTVQPLVSNQGWSQALDALERLRQERPINSGGLHYTRNQWYERD